jgi:hypothetical protein
LLLFHVNRPKLGPSTDGLDADLEVSPLPDTGSGGGAAHRRFDSSTAASFVGQATTIDISRRTENDGREWRTFYEDHPCAWCSHWISNS